MRLVSNVARGGASSWGSGYWALSTFGPDTEVYAKMLTAAADSRIELFLRVQSPNSGTLKAYVVLFDASADTVSFYRLDAGWGTNTQLTPATSAATIVANDIIGASVVGNTITAYVNGTAVATRTDSTYTSISGYIGASCEENGTGTYPSLDDFGGGTVVVAGTTRSRRCLTGAGV